MIYATAYRNKYKDLVNYSGGLTILPLTTSTLFNQSVKVPCFIILQLISPSHTNFSVTFDILHNTTSFPLISNLTTNNQNKTLWILEIKDGFINLNNNASNTIQRFNFYYFSSNYDFRIVGRIRNNSNTTNLSLMFSASIYTDLILSID